jgi:hypothetical protein
VTRHAFAFWRRSATIGAALGACALASIPLATPHAALAQEASEAAAPARTDSATYPFGVGEKLTYDVAVGGAKVGSGEMKIVGVDTVQGHPTFHSLFTVDGGFLMFKVHDVLESWFDTSTLSSRRFVQKIHEVNYEKERDYDIWPEKAKMQQHGYPEMASVPNPLDDGSFLYFVRTVPLEVGKTYTFNRYFRPDRNPVIVKVLRKEKVTVPAGTFDAIVIQPVIKSQGLFSEGGEAQIWLTDDPRHIVVQMKAKVPVLKTLDLYLQSYQPPITETAEDR